MSRTAAQRPASAPGSSSAGTRVPCTPRVRHRRGTLGRPRTATFPCRWSILGANRLRPFAARRRTVRRPDDCNRREPVGTPLKSHGIEPR